MSTEEFAGAQDLKRARRQRPVNTSRIDRLPPYSLEAEQGVLGCLMLDARQCHGQLVATYGAFEDFFYDLRNKTIYHAISQLCDQSQVVDLIIVMQQLADSRELEGVGGLAYLSSLQDATPSAANLMHYAGILYDKHQLRRVIHLCNEAVERVYGDQDDVPGLIEWIEREVLDIRGSQVGNGIVPVKQLVNDAIREIEQKHSTGGALTGLPTGFADLDKLTDGLQPGDLNILAAFPSAGKTALAMNIAEHIVLETKLPVGVFSLEMTGSQLVKRMMSSRARVNLRSVNEGFLAERDFPRLTGAASRLANSTLYIDDTSGLSVYQLRARARRMVQQWDIKFLVVDYLQLLNAADGRRKMENRQQEVADISRALKEMAKELRIPVLALSQLNDDGQLRESRAIGQDADGVWVLEEPDKEEDGYERRESHAVNLIIKKQRSGPRNVVVNLTFLTSITRFESAAKVSDDDVPDVPRGNPHND